MIEERKRITSKQWRFWKWLQLRWPFVRGWEWIGNRRKAAYLKWRDKK